MDPNVRWNFFIDVGGTFTDCIAQSPTGEIHRRKLLSSSSFSFSAIDIQPDPSQQEQIKVSYTPKSAHSFPNNFFADFHCKLLDENGKTIADGKVIHSSKQKLEVLLSSPVSRQCRPINTIQLSSYQPSPIIAVRWILELQLDQPLPDVNLRLGTTKGTNALLTRTGARCCLVTNKGFADATQIGDQRRPDLFALDIQKPDPLHHSVVEISGRIDNEGNELEEIDTEEVLSILKAIKNQGIQSVAISLLNSYTTTVHEKQVGQIAEELGFSNISLSSEVSSLIHYQKRSNTAIIDSYLNPILDSYIEDIQRHLGQNSELLLMTSGGSLISAEGFSGKDSLLSGPAGGVVGFADSARQAGFDKAIGFDMGGTSTDVSRLEERVALRNETDKFGYQIQAPSLEIETVAAGGGSICHFDGWRLLVGPSSAGANPGPACYGAGGPITVTDCNVWLQRIDPNHFPVPLDRKAIEIGLAKIAAQVESAGNQKPSLDNLALSFLTIANSHMATAIKTVTTRVGLDPRNFILVAFGGAAGQNACGVADLLGMRNILLSPDAGILSAVGMGKAKRGFQVAEGVGKILTEKSCQELPLVFSRLIDKANRQSRTFFSAKSENAYLFRVEACIEKTQQILTIDLEDLTKSIDHNYIRSKFWSLYQKQYGFRLDRELEILSARIAVEASNSRLEQPSKDNSSQNPFPQDLQSKHQDSKPNEKVLPLEEVLCSGKSFSGPLVLTHDLTTVWLEKGWEAEATGDGQLLMTKTPLKEVNNELPSDQTTTKQDSKIPCKHQPWDPLLLELFHHRVTEIATQMGLALEANCTSVNVKERLDFSCAVFDAKANLIVNAPHIPVHLGAMSQSVREVIEGEFDILPGDCYITNDPFGGGSHLPDVTVISPFFFSADVATESLSPDFWVASRAHHSEIGGVTPGSMPPFSKTLAEEGVLIPIQKIIHNNELKLEAVKQLLSNAPLPSRNVKENLQDIQAQISANQMGIQLMTDYCRSSGLSFVKKYSGFILDSSASQAKNAIQRLPDSINHFTDTLDCGLTIRLEATVNGDRLRLDFQNTDPPGNNNFNANSSIVQSAVLYCLRLLVPGDIPLNAGLLRCVDINLPYCFLNPLTNNTSKKNLPAVVGGNVETSQRIVDVILGALGISAASQGTMNNFLFGNHEFGFYETIGGGSGASSNCDGADAVHTHMTNTRLTDPEILEQRYPVRLEEFSVRKGSGGEGNHKGGNGMVRRFRFLEPLTVSLLTNRRTTQPYGADGGGSGQSGRNILITNDGIEKELPSSCKVDTQPGDQIEIRTPGGGGFGEPN